MCMSAIYVTARVNSLRNVFENTSTLRCHGNTSTLTYHNSTLVEIMPLFGNKFSPKKTPNRKLDSSVVSKSVDCQQALEELGVDVGPITLHLGIQDITFDNGEWVPESGPVSGKHKENQKLLRHIQQLEDENNMLKLKAEILMDMLTQTTAESHLQEKEITRFRKEVSSSRTRQRR